MRIWSFGAGHAHPRGERLPGEPLNGILLNGSATDSATFGPHGAGDGRAAFVLDALVATRTLTTTCIAKMLAMLRRPRARGESEEQRRAPRPPRRS